MTRIYRNLLVLFLALSGAACTHVKAWERGALAHPTMANASVTGPAEEHLYAVQEGAVGGVAAVESGCGCN